MHSKFSVRHLLQYFLPVFLAICLSTPSVAQDLIGSAKSPENKVLATELPQQSSIDTTHQLGSNTASAQQRPTADTVKVVTNTEAPLANESVNIQTKEEKLKMQAKAMAHLKAMLSVKKKKQVIVKISPYEQLVKLAFKGKGANGVNSYQDAAVLFCKQARDDNNAEAQFALGWMHANGKGFSKDEHTAAFFYHKAAEQGHYRAKNSLIDFKGDAALVQTPECMLPDAPPEPIVAKSELAPAGSNGNAFYVRGPIFDIVERLAPQYHIETDLAMAFIKVESNFNPKATSPKNAQGLMQLIPATAKRFHVKNPYNPEDNIKGGLAYLQWLMAYFEGDVRLVAAAYNAGEGAVNKYKGIPPYRETRNYVRKIYKLYRKSYHPFREDLLIGKRSEIIRVSSNN